MQEPANLVDGSLYTDLRRFLHGYSFLSPRNKSTLLDAMLAALPLMITRINEHLADEEEAASVAQDRTVLEAILFLIHWVAVINERDSVNIASRASLAPAAKSKGRKKGTGKPDGEATWSWADHRTSVLKAFRDFLKLPLSRLWPQNERDMVIRCVLL